MSHEVSETIQDKSGKWVNIYGRKTKKAGQRLPEDSTGKGHREYNTVEEAVKEAKERSKNHTKQNTPAGGTRDIDKERK